MTRRVGRLPDIALRWARSASRRRVKGIYGVGPHLDTRAGEVLPIGVKLIRAATVRERFLGNDGPPERLERSEVTKKYEQVDRDEARHDQG